MFKKKLKNKLENLKEKYKGKSAIIFGNGPSINSIDFSLLRKNKNIITLTTNQIADICIKKKFTPNLYTAFFCEPLRGKKHKINILKSINYPGNIDDALNAQRNIIHLLNNNFTDCFIHNWYKVFIKNNTRGIFINPKQWNRFTDFPDNAFEKFKLPENFLWHVATTPLFQICFYLDIKNIGIIGQDGYFEEKSSNHYENYVGYEHKEITKMKDANKRINQLLDACNYYSLKNGIKIYNLSLESKFKQFKKISYKEFEKKINTISI